MIIKLISVGKRVVIGVTKGAETLVSTNNTFRTISPDFINWGCSKAEHSTPEVVVEVYEQIEDATYPEIFGSVNQNLDHLTLTTSQIKNFVINNVKDYLLEAEWTCFRFLFKEGDEFFVADVRLLSEGKLDFRVIRFLDGSVRHAEYHHRIVVPQLFAN
jgi:hypothetical protein